MSSRENADAPWTSMAVTVGRSAEGGVSSAAGKGASARRKARRAPGNDGSGPGRRLHAAQDDRRLALLRVAQETDAHVVGDLPVSGHAVHAYDLAAQPHRGHVARADGDAHRAAHGHGLLEA